MSDPLLEEAKRRGLIASDEDPLMAEARKRGLIDAAPAATPEAPQSPGVGAMDMVTRGLTAGLSDYAAGAGRYLADKVTGHDTSFNDSLKSVRQDNAAYRKENPVRAYGGEIAGGVVSPIYRGIAGAVDKGLGMLGQVPRYLQYGAQGAAQGAAVGAAGAESEDGGLPSVGDLAKSTGEGAAAGGALGVALPAVTEAGAKAFKGAVGMFRDGAAAGAGTADDFKKAAQAAYKASEDAGVVISPQAMQKFAADLPGQLKGFHPVVNENAGKLIKMLQTEADKGPMTLSFLDGLRSVASGESLSKDLNDARLAGAITNKIDDFIDQIKPADLIAGGDERAAVDSLTAARDLWKTHSKLRDIERIVDTGENLSDPNWVKNQFRAIVRNPTKFNRYTPEEQKAIVDIAHTGLLEKALKLIPWRGIQMASTYAEPMAQTAKVNKLQGLIAGGGKAPPGLIFGVPPARALGAAARLPGPLLSPLMSGGSNQRP